MERRSIAVRGTVQGVGFRPFVYGLASRLELRGFVRNQTGGVRIEVEGESGRLDEFLDQLASKPPPLARIDALQWARQSPRGGDGFHIETSEHGAGAVVVAPDVATCDDCLAELFDPSDRRYRYPFLNCTNCGPRLTIVTGSPYDRERTTMAAFRMCAACRAEYEAPGNRRFHAQPTACPECGPRLAVLDARGRRVNVEGPLAHFVEAIRAGRIGALKGLGGYHLVCDACDGAAVAELRRRKHRNERPLAVMLRDLDQARALCQLSDSEQELLTSNRRPIVLLRKRAGYDLADGIAPAGNPLLGVMLPYTPLHHLLLHDVGGAPLVMTSGNRSDEPIAYEDRDAIRRLAGIADVFLVHDRPIHQRCDDSVTRVVAGIESPIRRSRGYAPRPIPLPVPCPRAILAVGGQLKATFALGQEERAVLSHHAGDLDNYEAYRAFERDIGLYERLFGCRPAVIAHDLHPDYASTRYARRRTAAEGMDLVAVQHHHAHVASCMAEHGLRGPVIGVTFDGTGYGTDGRVWGGEFLVGDYAGFRRAAHLRYVGMPGGDQAIREPWRMALAHLMDAGVSTEALARRLPSASMRTVARMIDRRFNTPETSSAGRLFDAVASLAGVRDRTNYEGQAAIESEWLAARTEVEGTYPVGTVEAVEGDTSEPVFIIDTRPMIAAIAYDVAHGTTAGVVARRFHTTMGKTIADVCARLRDQCGLNQVVLSGGVFMNALLAEEASCRLTKLDFEVYRHRLVPPNDGGLSLGQLAVGAARAGTGPDR